MERIGTITKPIAYKAKLKVTISNTIFQAVDVFNELTILTAREGVASALPDSLRKDFKTKGGRIVKTRWH